MSELSGGSWTGRRVGDAAVGLLAVVGTSVVTAALAYWFRESLFAVLHLATGRRDGVDAVGHAQPVVMALVVTAALLVGRLIGGVSVRWRRRIGERVSAARPGGGVPGRELTIGPTLLHAAGTWVGSVSLAPIGREAAIIETGAGFGALIGRWTRRSPDLLATAGMAAAFAAAYHAPLAGVLYVEAHLGLRRKPGATRHAVAGALVGHFTMLAVFHGHPVFSGQRSALDWGIVGLALLCVLPAFFASRVFLASRERLAALAVASAGRDHLRPVLFALVAGATVALVPLTAGNGMEGLRHSAVTATVATGAALCFGKMLATGSAIGSGAPAGVFSPSLAIAGGAALLSLHGLDALGVSALGSSWTITLVLTSVGIAIGLRAPVLAVVAVAEMCGDVRMVPACALVVGVAMGLERLVGGGRRRASAHVEAAVGHLDDGAPAPVTTVGAVHHDPAATTRRLRPQRRFDPRQTPPRQLFGPQRFEQGVRLDLGRDGDTDGKRRDEVPER